MLRENPLLCKLHGEVQTRLPAECREQTVRLLLCDDLLEKLRRQRLDVDTVGDVCIRHNGCGVAVDEHDLETIFPQCTARLGARIVKFCCLSDDDRAGADDHDLLQIFLARHTSLPLHQIPKLIKEIHIVVRSRRSFRMILHGEDRQRCMTQSLDRIVVDICMCNNKWCTRK